MQFQRFFSLDSAKAIKAREFGYLNAINYMAPANTAGVGNLCPHASAGCLALCLGWYSGQAGMVAGDSDTALNSVRKSRQAKARLFMTDRVAFFNEMIAGIAQAERKAQREGLKLCVRLNGATDIAWESVSATSSMFTQFPHIQFVDYTKNVKRALKHAAGLMPRNYHLTFSRSETNEADCARVLAAGGNVAVVVAGEFPRQWHGYEVVNGDAHDLRHMDAGSTHLYGQAQRGIVIALSPKGTRAKRDRSGFVVR
jgi:hypothetical protein